MQHCNVDANSRNSEKNSSFKLPEEKKMSNNSSNSHKLCLNADKPKNLGLK